MKQNPFAILFGGESITVELIDGSKIQVFVRSLPERWLLSVFLSVMENGAQTVELCCYLKADKGAQPRGAHPDIPVPAGYWPVPAGWADNLSDDGLATLYELAKQLNFDRAAKLAQGRIAAKKQIAPLNTKLMEQVTPLVVNALESLLSKSSISTLKSQSSPDTPASSA